MDVEIGSPQSGAGFVWVPGVGKRRNAYALFERTFEIAEVPERFPLHLFADTRYRLRVNGQVVGTGPARFVTSHPEFDTFDLAPLLRVGCNVVRVEVNFYGASSFQTMPDGKPGFIAWGGSVGIDLATPGGWRASDLQAWRSDSPLFSFAQGPVEICDTRQMEVLDFRPAAPLAEEDCPWGRLAPYSGRDIPGKLVEPARIEAAGALRPGPRILGVMAKNSSHSEISASGFGKRPRSAVATWIRSPRPQKINLSCLWCDLLLNGEPVEREVREEDRGLGNHESATLNLVEGWNLLTCSFELLSEQWAFLLGFPPGADISLHGLPDEACELPLAAQVEAVPGSPVLPRLGDGSLPPGWELQDGRPANLTPARVCGWDRIEDGAFRGLPASRLAEVSPIVAEGAVWCLRFEREFLGHPIIEVEAPEGSILDVACDDWLTAEGTVAIYRSNPFTDSADRFILQGGRQAIELFHVRGGKYLQVTLRAPGGPAALTLHSVRVRSRQTTGPSSAMFRSGHEELDWAFDQAVGTLAASTSSAYADCPWRERGMYLGDALVNMHIDLIAFRDLRTARRMLRQFAQAQRENGLMPACAPSWLTHSFGDYTMLWIIALRDFWAHTGDLAVVEELYPALERIWSSPAWKVGECGLWAADAAEMFIDWGVLREERSGAGNAVLNVLRFAALRASAQLASALRLWSEAERYREEAGAVEEGVFSVLWNEQQGRLSASVGAKTPALHANILALYCEIGSPAQRAAILRYIEPAILGNLDRGLARGQFSGHAELYFLYFLLPALVSHGRPDLAERVIAEHYGYLRSLGDDTLPECFCRVEQAVGSRCHSWSGSPAVYAARYVLGIRLAQPGDPSRLLFKPETSGIMAASGRIAHIHGWIEVAWEREAGGQFHARLSAPDGVEIIPVVPLSAKSPGTTRDARR